MTIRKLIDDVLTPEEAAEAERSIKAYVEEIRLGAYALADLIHDPAASPGALEDALDHVIALRRLRDGVATRLANHNAAVIEIGTHGIVPLPVDPTESCPGCGGSGTRETLAPYTSRTPTPPYVEVSCRPCGGTGGVEARCDVCSERARFRVDVGAGKSEAQCAECAGSEE